MTDRSAAAATFDQFLASEQLPAWLRQVLTTLFDGQDPDTATRWGQRIVEWGRSSSLLVAGGLDSDEHRRTQRDGLLPIEVVHDWHARSVVAMMLQVCEPADAAADLQTLHARAADGARFGEAEWRAAIEPALHELYRHAYSYVDAYASAHASASAYASANNFSQDGAVEFADSYAKLSADANRQSYAVSNAIANAAVLASAYAAGDLQAYAEAYPFALVHACAHAFGNQANRSDPAGDQPASQTARRQAAYAQLADGLADSF